MRSKIAQRIYSETPEKVKENVQAYGDRIIKAKIMKALIVKSDGLIYAAEVPEV